MILGSFGSGSNTTGYFLSTDQLAANVPSNLKLYFFFCVSNFLCINYYVFVVYGIQSFFMEKAAWDCPMLCRESFIVFLLRCFYMADWIIFSVICYCSIFWETYWKISSGEYGLRYCISWREWLEILFPVISSAFCEISSASRWT